MKPKTVTCIIILTIGIGTDGFFAYLFPIFLQNLINKIKIVNHFREIKIILLQLFLLFMLKAVFDLLTDIVQNKLQLDFELEFSYHYFFNLFRNNIIYHEKHNTASLVEQLRYDTTKISSIFGPQVISIVSQLSQCIASLTGLFRAYPLMICWIMIFLPIKFLSSYLLGKIGYRLNKSYIVADKGYSRWVGNIFQSILELKLNPNFDLQKKYSNIQRNVLGKQFRLDIFEAIIRIFDEMSTILFVCLCLAYPCYLFIEHSIGSIGQLAAIYTYLTLIISNMSGILNIPIFIGSVKPSYQRFINLGVTSKNKMSSNNKINVNTLNANKINYNVHGVRIFKDLSFKLLRGQSMKVIGYNGSGKTTLIKILLGYYPINNGQIFINDISADSSNKLYISNFAVCFQFPSIIDENLEENLSLFTQKTNLHTSNHVLIDKWIQQVFDIKHISQNEISGGQLKKIALLRVLLSDRDILIFDEPTESLDITSKKEFFEILDSIKPSKIIIVITHDIDFNWDYEKIIQIGER